jgi:hypothetical protein
MTKFGEEWMELFYLELGRPDFCVDWRHLMKINGEVSVRFLSQRSPCTIMD